MRFQNYTAIKRIIIRFMILIGEENVSSPFEKEEYGVIYILKIYRNISLERSTSLEMVSKTFWALHSQGC